MYVCGWEQVYIFFVPTNILNKWTLSWIWKFTSEQKNVSWMRPNVVLDPTDMDSMYGQKQLKHSSKYLLLCSKNVNADNVHSWVDYPFNQFARSFAGASSILAASSAVIRMVFGWLEKCFRMWELKLWWRGRKSKLFGKNFNTASVEEWNEKGMMFDCSHIELHNVHHDASLAQFENLTRIICHNDTHRTTFISRIPKKKSTSLVLILICNSMLQRINACLHHWDIMTA